MSKSRFRSSAKDLLRKTACLVLARLARRSAWRTGTLKMRRCKKQRPRCTTATIASKRLNRKPSTEQPTERQLTPKSPATGGHQKVSKKRPSTTVSTPQKTHRLLRRTVSGIAQSILKKLWPTFKPAGLQGFRRLTVKTQIFCSLYRKKPTVWPDCGASCLGSHGRLTTSSRCAASWRQGCTTRLTFKSSQGLKTEKSQIACRCSITMLLFAPGQCALQLPAPAKKPFQGRPATGALFYFRRFFETRRLPHANVEAAFAAH